MKTANRSEKEHRIYSAMGKTLRIAGQIAGCRRVNLRSDNEKRKSRFENKPACVRGRNTRAGRGNGKRQTHREIIGHCTGRRYAIGESRADGTVRRL